MKPNGIPNNYVEWAPGEWCHPSRLEQFKMMRGRGDLPKVIAEMELIPVPPKPPKRMRQSTKPLMNKLESEFKAYYETYSGHALYPQSMRFMLGNGIWYKPDFVLCCATMGMKAFEVKGPHAFRGGFENLKVAAHNYPFISWILVWKEDGKWNQQPVLP